MRPHRVWIVLTYPFLLLSILMLGGLLFTGAFVERLTLRNATGQALSITPLGTAHGTNRRRSLALVTNRVVCLPAWQLSGFRVGPGERISLLYDSDDVGFTEFVVVDEQGGRYQLAPEPMDVPGKRRALPQRDFVIDNPQNLPPADPTVSEAASDCQKVQARNSIRVSIVWLLLVGPWFVYAAARLSVARIERANQRVREVTA